MGGVLGEKGGGIKKYKLVVTENHGDVKYSIGNMLNDIVITIYCWMGTRFIGVITF